MNRTVYLAALSLLLAPVSSEAFDPAAQAALVKSTETMEVGMNPDYRPDQAPQDPNVEASAVEPAAGAEAETAQPAETTRELQRQIKLPRKN